MKNNTLKSEDLLTSLEKRFNENIHRHKNIQWEDVNFFLMKDHNLLTVLQKMEETGGEPDVFEFSDKRLAFVDCSKETPIGHRNFCYDNEALESRKTFKPKNSAEQVAIDLGIEILDEKQYMFIQSFEAFDTKTSSWLKTPEKVRKLGGALFGDRRFDHVFVYHNGAESYYQARGFRGLIFIKK